MKKIILLVVTSVMLFGESEDLYKEKYDYLMGRYTDAEKNVNEASRFVICFNGDYSCQREQIKKEKELPDLERDKNAIKDKLMDLKFKMQDELKTTPEWFKFKG